MLQLPSEFSTRPRRRASWLQLGGNYAFEWNRIDLPIHRLPPALENLRIVHLTDTHAKPHWCLAFDRLIEALEAHEPDLILFTGDFVDNVLDPRPAWPVLERFVPRLRSRLGVFAIVGNHDGDLLSPRLPSLGVHVIQDQMVTLEDANGAVELIGLPGPRRDDLDPDFVARMPPRRAGVPRIALAHYPDLVRKIEPLHADLMLSGHTHGGQICLPTGHAIITHDALPKRFARGMHRVGETLLVVNRGFGTTKWPIRVCCPPEIIEIRLRGGESD